MNWFSITMYARARKKELKFTSSGFPLLKTTLQTYQKPILRPLYENKPSPSLTQDVLKETA